MSCCHPIYLHCHFLGVMDLLVPQYPSVRQCSAVELRLFVYFVKGHLGSEMIRVLSSSFLFALVLRARESNCSPCINGASVTRQSNLPNCYTFHLQCAKVSQNPRLAEQVQKRIVSNYPKYTHPTLPLNSIVQNRKLTTKKDFQRCQQYPVVFNLTFTVDF